MVALTKGDLHFGRLRIPSTYSTHQRLLLMYRGSLHIAFTSFLVAVITSIYAQTSQDVIAGMSLERLERYDDFIQKEIETEEIAGAVIMIQRKGELVYQNALGYHTLAKETPLELDDIFYIQSMTKPIIATALMMLYEEGHFQLYDPVSRYIPEFKELKVSTDPEKGSEGPTEPLDREITMVDLLTHTAGLSHGLGGTTLDREIFQGQYMQEHTDIQARVQNLLSMPLFTQPGERWYYSSAPDVLSVLIEQFSGISTDEFLRTRIFEPLQMRDTGYNLPESNHDRVMPVLAKGRSSIPNSQGHPYKMEGNTIWSGVNGLFSTAADYLKYCQMMLNGGEYKGTRLLSPRTVELMTMNHIGELRVGSGEGFGLGFGVVTDVAAYKRYGSKGTSFWSGAFSTHFFIDPEEELTAVFMTQRNPGSGIHSNMLRQLVYQAIVD